MDNTNLATTHASHGIIEAVIAAGDLARLTPDQRNTYYVTVCQSIGLNPLTRPFEYITLNGKLTLYARKDATDQLRAIKGVSIVKCDVNLNDADYVIVTTEARDAAGRTDIDVGVVSRKDMRGDVGNVIMKAVTKSKRRVTLSLCGLGMLDESEVETIPDARPFNEQKPAPVVIAAPTPAAPSPTKTVTPTIQPNIAVETAKAELRALGLHAKAVLESGEVTGDASQAIAEAMQEARIALKTDAIANIRAASEALKKALP
jgi:hypothetical protein